MFLLTVQVKFKQVTHLAQSIYSLITILWQFQLWTEYEPDSQSGGS